jgi:hypothetical protein
MPGQKREARLRADDPGIHPKIEWCLTTMDCRVKPGNDGWSTGQAK